MNGGIRNILTTAALSVLFLLSPPRAIASIYTYVDSGGTIHFSNVPNDSRYRPLIITPPRQQPARKLSYSPQYTRIKDARELDPFIQDAARRYQVDPLLVKAVIHAESNFNHQAVSPKGAMGLMQLMPGTMNDMDVLDPFDPAQNIRGGTRYLSLMLDRFKGDYRLALAAYNAGPERVAESGGIPRIPETVEYVQRVMMTYQNLQTRRF